MKFEEFSQEDIIELFNTLSMEVDQLFFLVDNSLRVQYFNRAFTNFVKKGAEEILDRPYGDALGCGNIIKDSKECAFTNYCMTCSIRKNFHQVFDRTIEKADFDFVREYVIRGETLVRHLHFKIVPLTLQGEMFALVIIDDLHDKNLVKMYLDPDSSI